MVGIGPTVGGGEVLDLPESKSHEGHETEPETLVDGVETDAVDEDFFEESANGVESVDGFVFEEWDDKGESCVDDDESEVVPGTEEEGGLADSLLELSGGGVGGIVLWHKWS